MTEPVTPTTALTVTSAAAGAAAGVFFGMPIGALTSGFVAALAVRVWSTTEKPKTIAGWLLAFGGLMLAVLMSGLLANIFGPVLVAVWPVTWGALILANAHSLVGILTGLCIQVVVESTPALVRGSMSLIPSITISKRRTTQEGESP